MEVSKEEKIGFHKGAITTLIKERQELIRLLKIVEQLISAHMSELEKLGVAINVRESQQKEEEKKEEKSNEKFENLL